MAPPDDAPSPDTLASDALPRHTTPTWEVELLISGVAVFAMLQLPGWLGDRLFGVIPRVDPAWGKALQLFDLYLTCAAVILAGTFAVHLLLRAQWIALVGMHSVHPDGIRWDRLRMGPLQRAIEQRRRGDIPAGIERADNRATTVFALGVVLASNLLKVSLLFAVILLARWLAQALLGVDIDVLPLLTVVVAVMVLPFVLASQVDRHAGARLAPASPGGRVLARILDAYSRIGIGRRSAAMALHASHGGERRTNLVATAVIGLAVTAVMFGLQGQASPERLGQYALFPEADALPDRAVTGAHYDDQRDPLHDPPLPFIPSMVADGPYLKLVVPYRPPAGGSAGCGAGASPLFQLDCLQRAHPVQLDGRPLGALRYDIGSDPRSDRPALVAMLDVRALAPGRHVLRVARQAGARAPGGAPAFDDIAFWR